MHSSPIVERHRHSVNSNAGLFLSSPIVNRRSLKGTQCFDIFHNSQMVRHRYTVFHTLTDFTVYQYWANRHTVFHTLTDFTVYQYWTNRHTVFHTLTDFTVYQYWADRHTVFHTLTDFTVYQYWANRHTVFHMLTYSTLKNGGETTTQSCTC